MKLSDLTSADEVKAEALRNPAVRAEWNRTAVARELASRMVRYRAEHGLSQAELGTKLGVSQPYVARLESGDQLPTLATLARLPPRGAGEPVLKSWSRGLLGTPSGAASSRACHSWDDSRWCLAQRAVGAAAECLACGVRVDCFRRCRFPKAPAGCTSLRALG